VGTGLALTREQRAAYDDTIVVDDNRGREQSLPSEEQEPEGLVDEPCPDCVGTRLNPTARAVTFDAQAITDVAQWTVSDTRAWIDGLHMTGRDAEIARAFASPRNWAVTCKASAMCWTSRPSACIRVTIRSC
jgi:excinuclease ABC subunit A